MAADVRIFSLFSEQSSCHVPASRPAPRSSLSSRRHALGLCQSGDVVAVDLTPDALFASRRESLEERALVEREAADLFLVGNNRRHGCLRILPGGGSVVAGVLIRIGYTPRPGIAGRWHRERAAGLEAAL